MSFAAIFMKDISLKMFALPLSGFGTRLMMASFYELGRAPACSVFWERLFRFGFVSSSSVCWNLPVKSCEAELGFFLLFALFFLFPFVCLFWFVREVVFLSLFLISI